MATASETGQRDCPSRTWLDEAADCYAQGDTGKAIAAALIGLGELLEAAHDTDQRCTIPLLRPDLVRSQQPKNGHQGG